MKAQTQTALYGAFAIIFAAALTSCSGANTVPAASNATSAQSTIASAPRYRLVTLPSGLVPTKINNGGIIIGHDVSTNHPFEYVQGHVTELPLLSGDTFGLANDVNNSGDIVGLSTSPAVFQGCTSACASQHAVAYVQGQVKDLGALPAAAGAPANIINEADAINDAGEIVGASGCCNNSVQAALTIFAPGAIHAITVSGQTVYGFLTGVNNAGEIVGASEPDGFPPPFGSIQPFSFPNTIACSPPVVSLNGAIIGINNAGATIWRSGDGTFTYCQVGTNHPLPLAPIAINDRGDVIGSGIAPELAVYAKGKLYRAADLYADPNILPRTTPGALYVSKSRAITGIVVSIAAGDAALYSNGTLYDLNNLLVNSPGFALQNPTSINDKGDIVGTTITPSAEIFSYLLVRQ